jgi:hypothetical protein
VGQGQAAGVGNYIAQTVGTALRLGSTLHCRGTDVKGGVRRRTTKGKQVQRGSRRPSVRKRVPVRVLVHGTGVQRLEERRLEPAPNLGGVLFEMGPKPLWLCVFGFDMFHSKKYGFHFPLQIKIYDPYPHGMHDGGGDVEAGQVPIPVYFPHALAHQRAATTHLQQTALVQRHNEGRLSDSETLQKLVKGQRTGGHGRDVCPRRVDAPPWAVS